MTRKNELRSHKMYVGTLNEYCYVINTLKSYILYDLNMCHSGKGKTTATVICSVITHELSDKV
jgi:hypothetical protein